MGVHVTVTTSLHLTNDGAAAEDVRRMLEVVCGSSSGINAATDLAVAQRGAGANMSVDVAAGTCWIQEDPACATLTDR